MQTTPFSRASKASWRTCWIAALTCVLCGLALTSCSIGTRATRAPLPTETAPSPPPGPQANQRRLCPALPPARTDLVPDLLANHDAVVALYRDCSARHSSLLQSIDAWEATAWQWYCGWVKRNNLDDSACRAATPTQ